MKVFLSLMVVFGAFLLAGCSKSWNEEVLLHDGHTVKVKRKMTLDFSEASLNDTIHFNPNTHSIEAINPSTNKVVKWTGAAYINPIMLEFINDSAFLAVESNMQRLVTRPLLYGCPSVPYVFLKLDIQNNEWFPIHGKDIPTELKLANLAIDVDVNYFKEGQWQDLVGDKDISYYNERGISPVYDSSNKSAKTIQRWNLYREKDTNGYYKVNIPKTPDEWNYKHQDQDVKKIFVQFNDCRPKLKVTPELINEGKLNAKAGNDTTPIRTDIQSIKTMKEYITHEMHAQQRGNWNSVGYLSESCKGIVEKIEKVFFSSSAGYDIKEEYSGYEIVLSNTGEIAKKIQLQQINQTSLVDTVICDKSLIYTIIRKDKKNLIVHRFNLNGSLKDAFPVILLDTEKAIQGTDWGELWNIIPGDGHLAISLVDFERSETIRGEGSIIRKTNYSIILPTN